jgi:SOS-response transcriptional repressor LexA
MMMNWTGCLKNRTYRDLIRAIASFERQGKTPLTRDLEMELKRSNQLLQVQLARLAEVGILAIDGGFRQPKQIRLTGEGHEVAKAMGAPILGTIPAGLLRAVPETDGRDLEGAPMFRDSWDEVLPPTEDFGVLIVKGDSMIGDFIMEGDQVQLEMGVKLTELEPGEIAAVMVGEDYEATLKHVEYDRETQMVTLRASNLKYQPIVVPAAQVHIVGAMFGIVRLAGTRRSRK